MDSNEKASQGPLLFRLGIVMTILPTLAIFFRLWSRIITTANTKLWWDDWFALLAWGACIVNCAFTIRGVQLGLGKHFQEFKSIDDVTELLRLFYVSQIVFDSGIAFAKFSVLFFYRRVFSSRSKTFNVAHGTTFALVVVFILYKLPAQIFSCVPPSKNWEPEIEGHCENDYTNFGLLLAGLVLDVLTDLLILLLPMPLLYRLHTTKMRKLALIGAFVLGYVTLVTSLGRTAAFISIKPHLDDPDISWYQVPELAWSLAEISVSVVSICVPSWFYLVKRWVSGGVASLFTSRDLSDTPRKILRGSRENPGFQLGSEGENCSMDHWNQQNSDTSDIQPIHLRDVASSTVEDAAPAKSTRNATGTIHVRSDVCLTYRHGEGEEMEFVTRREWV
ncbi:hypothetical protein F4823DRAFT_185688 [Ustulina deusta]|nr:hypothetical protein F4823DRAFT_185688 [Ustulina deusta]